MKRDSILVDADAYDQSVRSWRSRVAAQVSPIGNLILFCQ
jgi:hypothetical protein